MRQQNRPNRHVLGMTSEGIPRSLITRNKEAADDQWATIARGEYWIDGAMWLHRPGLTATERAACERIAVNSNFRRLYRGKRKFLR